MGINDNQDADKAKQAQIGALARQQKRHMKRLRYATGQIGSFFSNAISTRMTRAAYQRTSPIRSILIVILTGCWIVFGTIGTLKDVNSPETQKTETTNTSTKIAPSPEENKPAEATLADSGSKAFAKALCTFRQGSLCDYVKPDSKASTPTIIGQIAFTFLALITILFSFWRQLIGGTGKFFRRIGGQHVIVTGSGAVAEVLARASAQTEKPKWQGRATVLIKRDAEESEVADLGADGVTLIIGSPTDPKVLEVAGAKSAIKIAALSSNDAENIAVIGALKSLIEAKPDNTSFRIESKPLRDNLPSNGAINAASAFSLSDVAARLLARQQHLLDEMTRDPETKGFHAAIIGWDETAIAAAERFLRMMWMPGFAAPKITVFSEDAIQAREIFQARFPLAFEDPDLPDGTPRVWTADIQFETYDWQRLQNAWMPILACQDTRGRVTAVIVSYTDDQETLHCAAALAARISDEYPTVYARDDAYGMNAAALSAYSNPRIRPFAEQTELLSPGVLVDRSLDEAARNVHERYVERCALTQGRETYADALKSGRGVYRWSRLFKGAPKSLPDDLDEKIKTLELNFTATFGEAAFNRLRSLTAEEIIAKGAFQPATPAQCLWENLAEHYIETNRAAADHASIKLRAFGFRPAKDQEKGTPVAIPKEWVTYAVAETEHLRWAADKTLSGWRYGQRSDAKKTHPDLIPYSTFDPAKLPEAIAKDCTNWIEAGATAALTHKRLFVRLSK